VCNTLQHTATRLWKDQQMGVQHAYNQACSQKQRPIQVALIIASLHCSMPQHLAIVARIASKDLVVQSICARWCIRERERTRPLRVQFCSLASVTTISIFSVTHSWCRWLIQHLKISVNFSTRQILTRGRVKGGGTGKFSSQYVCVGETTEGVRKYREGPKGTGRREAKE